MAHKTWRISQRAAVTVISVLLGTSVVQAAQKRGIYDPPGNGNDIPGFTGDALFEISDSCISTSSGAVFRSITGVSGSCEAATMDTNTTLLYSYSTSDPLTPGSHVGQFTLLGGDVLGVWSESNEVLGLDTNPLPVGGVFGSGPYSDVQFWIQFVSNQCPVGICDPTPFGLESGHVRSAPAAICYADAECIPELRTDGSTAYLWVLQPSQVVPEPGTLALILGALGGGWLARRRKKAAAG